MTTPITYYGGKQNLVTHILPLLPAHTSYVEPFCGGAAVFWAKNSTKMEVLNDTNKELINFYRVLQAEFTALVQEIQVTLQSRTLHQDARTYDTPGTLFYCDPPYYNSDCGHYDGYTIEDYKMLLDTLTKIEGKFLLSSYPSPILKEYVSAHSWYQKEFKLKLSVNTKGTQKEKVEVLTANY